ncbi:two-component sensor histidine kinase BarA [uncultured Psychrosphaera sp.]|uniref:two-component sensor histidine kinase BarA n=1 Tax=uncultured Psychrosphaera sp. TaxID=1403522 RepID=UPI0030FBA411
MKELLSLRQRALMITILPTILIGLLLGGYLTYKRYTELDDNLIQRGIYLSEPLSILSADAILNSNQKRLEETLNMAHRKASPIVQSISVFLPNHQLFVSSNMHEDFSKVRLKPGRLLSENTQVEMTDDKIYIRSPIYSAELEVNDSFIFITKNGKTLFGYLVVELSRDQARLEQQSSVFTLILILLLVIISTTVFSFFFIKDITSSINELNKAVKSIADGDYKYRVNNNMVGELESLRLSVNSVAKAMYVVTEQAEHNISEHTQELQQTVEQLEVQNIELNIAKRDALNANDVKSQFLANMSHELRTPLNGVLGFTRQLKKTQLNNNQRDFLDTIDSSANNLLQIINDILDFSKLDAGKMELESIPFALRDTVNEVMTLLAPSIFDKSLDIHINIDTRVPDELQGDPVRLKQIIINLVGNSIKFTRDGYIRLDVKYLGSHEYGHHIKFIVSDTGIGIEDKVKDKLFAAFGQADNSTTRKYGGTGLGLIICKKIVESMKGSIHFNSELNKGSEFFFDMYIKENNTAIGQQLPLKEIENKKILYFDSCSQAFNDINQLLNDDTELVVTSCDQDSAYLEALQKDKFDIVLIGRKISPSTVSELKKYITVATQYCSHVYTIINSISPNLKEAIIGSGARACFSMPVNHRKLITTFAEPYIKDINQQQALTTMFGGMKVLAVDDTPANLKLLTTLLDEMGMIVDVAHDGLAALHQAQKHIYDVIFMDIQMPIMDGITACQKIKESSLNESTAIISVTAHAGQDEQKRMLEVGFTGYLAKPIDEEMLTQVILDACPGCQLQIRQPTAVPVIATQPDESLPAFAHYHHVDWSLALTRAAGKKELAIEMFVMLVKGLPELAQSLKQSYGDEDLETLLGVIHKFHGACCYTGVPKLKQLAELIETGLKNEKNIAAVDPELLELIDEIDHIINEANNWDLN